MSARRLLLVAALGGLAALALGARRAYAARAQLGALPDTPADNFTLGAQLGWDELPGPVYEPAAEELPAGEYASDDQTGGDVPVVDSYLLPAAYSFQGFFMGKKILSVAGLDALRRLEGFSALPYRDAAGHWTIGYGHKIGLGEDFASVSEEQGTALLSRDVNAAEDAVNALVAVPLSQAQFDALVSFVYNVGRGAFRKSTLLRLLNAGDYAAVPVQLARWRYVTRGGRKIALAGLESRRAQEGALFASVPAGGTVA